MKKNRILRILVGAGVSLCLFACASSPEPNYERVTDYTRIAIVKAGDIPALEQLKSSGEKAMEGAGAGGTAGMATGAAAGLACGPLWWGCSSGLAIMGWLVGGAGGLVYSGVTSVAVSVADAELVGERFSAVIQRRDLQEEFFAELRAGVDANLQGDPEAADVLVSPVLTAIDLDEDSKQRIHVIAKGRLLFSWSGEQREAHFGREEFEVKSPSASIAEWVADDAKRFDEFLSFSLEEMTEQMSRFLADHVAAPVQ